MKKSWKRSIWELKRKQNLQKIIKIIKKNINEQLLSSLPFD